MRGLAPGLVLALLAASPPPRPSSGFQATTDDSELDRRIGRIEQRIEALEERLGALGQAFQDRLDEIDREPYAGCIRTDGVYNGRSEVMVTVGPTVLRFVAVEPAGPVTIGLSEERASELLREVQHRSAEAIVPWILRSVPAVDREVESFFLQDRLIDPRLYAALTDGRDAGEVSLEQVSLFLAELNVRCEGTARFELPTEEQFVAAAQSVYDPVSNGLIPCAALKDHGSALELSQLLGHVWQLTRSPCEPLGAETPERCPEGSYIRKGGTATSANPLECMPEYRSVAVPGVAQKQTSFRLVLAN